MNITQDEFYEKYVDDDLNLILPNELNDKIHSENLNITSLYYFINGVLNDNEYEITTEIKEKANYYFNTNPDLILKNKWDDRIARNENFIKIIYDNNEIIGDDPNNLLEIYKTYDIFASLNDCIYDLNKYNTKQNKIKELEEILKNI